MIRGIQNYMYGERVRQHLAKRLVETCGSQLGEFAWNACITYVAMDLELGIIPKDYFDRLRKSGLPTDDAAVALLDTSITCMRDRHKNGSNLSQTIKLMEEALDALFLDRPGRLAPRNGSVGRSLDDFAAEPEL